MLSAHLTENGITLQWIDSALRDHEQHILMRTFSQAFPHVLLWKIEGLQLLLGSNAPMKPDLAVTSRTFTPEVAQALAPVKLTSPQDILAGFTLADDDLRASLGPGLAISDDHPYNEYFRLLRIRNLWQWLERQPFALTASP